MMRLGTALALAAIVAITIASILLSTNFGSNWGMSLGAFGVLGACVLWGLDNNLTRNISAKDPLTIVAWKGLVAGSFSLILGLVLGQQLPALITILSILLLGFISYGLSTMLFIYSMRGLGAARTSALYGTAPLAGVLLSILIFKDPITFLFGIAAVMMVAGALLLANEEHAHFHIHMPVVHEHRHQHDDDFHSHSEDKDTHSHEHEHPQMEHEHGHMPDIHHRHEDQRLIKTFEYMTTIKLSEKQVFVLKATLGTILALNAGDYLALRTDIGFYRTFSGDLNYWLFPLLCLVAIQWILASEYLPKGWVFTGIVGCIIVIPVMAITYYLQMLLLNEFAKGFFATIPQSFLMRNRNGLLWVLANSVGWILSALYSNIHIHLLQAIASIPILQTFIYHTYDFPLGIMIGLSLYNIKTKSSQVENSVKEGKE